MQNSFGRRVVRILMQGTLAGQLLKMGGRIKGESELTSNFFPFCGINTLRRECSGFLAGWFRCRGKGNSENLLW